MSVPTTTADAGIALEKASGAATRLQDGISAVALLVDARSEANKADRARNALDWIAGQMDDDCDTLQNSLEVLVAAGKGATAASALQQSILALTPARAEALNGEAIALWQGIETLRALSGPAQDDAVPACHVLWICKVLEGHVNAILDFLDVMEMEPKKGPDGSFHTPIKPETAS